MWLPQDWGIQLSQSREMALFQMAYMYGLNHIT
jgi:hypothetical protein